MVQKKKVRKKPVRKIKFEVTRKGVAGIAVVCFCVFLWMFLLGVWAGQSMLQPNSENVTVDQPIVELNENKKLPKK